MLGLKSSYKFFKAQKLYPIVGIVALSVGFAAIVVSIRLIKYDFEYDKRGRNFSKIYRINSNLSFGGREEKYAISSAALGPLLKAESSVNFKLARFRKIEYPVVQVGDNKFFENNFYYSDTAAFSIFDLSILAGDKNSSLTQAEGIVLSKQIATKYFGKYEISIGRTIQLNEVPYVITAVYDDLPNNSHFRFDCLISYKNLEREESVVSIPVQLWNFKDFTYIQVSNSKDIALIEADFNNLYKNHMAFNGELVNAKFNPIFQPLDKTHFETDYQYDLPNGNIYRFYILIGLVAIIFFVALNNFSSLMVGLYLKRVREIAVKRMYGKSVPSILLQIIIECAMMTFIAIVIGILVNEFLLSKLLNEINTGYTVHFDSFLFIVSFSFLVFFSLFVGVQISSIILRLPLTLALRKVIFAVKGGRYIQTGILILQYTVVFFCMTVVWLINQNLEKTSDEDCGFQVNRLGVIKINGHDVQTINVLKAKISQLSYVTRSSFSVGVPGSQDISRQGFEIETLRGKEKMIIDVLFSDENLIPTLGLKLLEGRYFESISQNVAIINRRAADIMNFESAIGKHIGFLNNDKFEIIGVVDNFNLYPNRDLEPLVILKGERNFNYLLLQYEISKTKDLNNYIKTLVFSNQISVIPEVTLLKDVYFSALEDKKSQRTIFSLVGLLSLLLCIMGLMGVSMFYIAAGKVEYCIRKVYGASVPSLVRLSYEKILHPAIAGLLLSFPITIGIVKQLGLGHVTFNAREVAILAFYYVVVIIFCILSITFQSFRLASINPAIGLSHE